MVVEPAMAALWAVHPGELIDAVHWADFVVSQPNFSISMVSQRAEYIWANVVMQQCFLYRYPPESNHESATCIKMPLSDS